MQLFRYNQNEKILFEKLMSLLKANFAENGSNESNHQNEVYGLLINYLKEVGGHSCIQQIINIGRTMQLFLQYDVSFFNVVSISFEAQSRTS